LGNIQKLCVIVRKNKWIYKTLSKETILQNPHLSVGRWPPTRLGTFSTSTQLFKTPYNLSAWVPLVSCSASAHLMSGCSAPHTSRARLRLILCPLLSPPLISCSCFALLRAQLLATSLCLPQLLQPLPHISLPRLRLILCHGCLQLFLLISGFGSAFGSSLSAQLMAHLMSGCSGPSHTISGSLRSSCAALSAQPPTHSRASALDSSPTMLGPLGSSHAQLAQTAAKH
jgi:hypothetical protein